jgi:hypothetical protein
MSSVFVSTRQQRFACARLPDPHLTRHARLFHIAHHDHVTDPAACGGLKPPPAGRLRRADNPSSPAQHRISKLYLHRTPFRVRDTPPDELTIATTKSFSGGLTCMFLPRSLAYAVPYAVWIPLIGSIFCSLLSASSA